MAANTSPIFIENIKTYTAHIDNTIYESGTPLTGATGVHILTAGPNGSILTDIFINANTDTPEYNLRIYLEKAALTDKFLVKEINVPEVTISDTTANNSVHYSSVDGIMRLESGDKLYILPSLALNSDGNDFIFIGADY